MNLIQLHVFMKQAYFDGPQNSAFDEGPLPILMLHSYWPPCSYHNNMKVILGLQQMKCRARLILGKLLENSQRGIEQVLPRFHLIIPEYGLNSRVSDLCCL